MPGYGASPPLAGGLTFAALADAGGGPDRDARRDAARTSSASRWAGRSRCTPRCGTPGACARSRCSTRARPSASTAPTPRPGSALRLDALDAGETPASMAEPVLRSIMAPGVDGRRVAAAVASMARISADGLRAAVEFLPTHDVRDAPRRDRRADARARRRARRGDAARLRARRSPTASPARELQIIPGAGHISNLEAPDAVNARCASTSTPPRPRDDRVALDRRLRAPARAVRARATARSSRCCRSRPAARSSSTPRGSRRRCSAGASSTSSCPTPANPGPVPLRSTGASVALAGNPGAIAGARGRRPRDRLHRRGAAARARARRDPAAAARAC